MLPYTFLSLQSDLQAFLIAVERVNVSYFIAFRVQMFTGCRFSELRNIARFSVVDSSHFSLIPEKGNDVRYFDNSIVPAEFLTYINNQDNFFEMLRLSTASNYFRYCFRSIRVFHGDKQLTTHLFRHHFCKYLKKDGFTDAQIKTALGEREQKNADNYIYSDLYYTAR